MTGHALLLEWKFSADTVMVAVRGYQRAITYAAELHSELAPEITAVVVAPEGIFAEPVYLDVVAGRIGVVPSSLRKRLSYGFVAKGRTALDP